MKKLASLILVLVLTLTLGVGILTAMQPPEATGHLDWDSTDKVWRCVGSPINCDFQN
jgi:hypothetical protein